MWVSSMIGSLIVWVSLIGSLLVSTCLLKSLDTFYVIKFEDIPKDWLNEICYTSVVCEVRPGNKDPNLTRITICGTNVCYPGDVGTNTSPLELFNIMIKIILSRAGAKYVCFYIENFYLSTPLGRPEYVKFNFQKFLNNSSRNTY